LDERSTSAAPRRGRVHWKRWNWDGGRNLQRSLTDRGICVTIPAMLHHPLNNLLANCHGIATGYPPNPRRLPLLNCGDKISQFIIQRIA
jgi:hypothetical protein